MGNLGWISSTHPSYVQAYHWVLERERGKACAWKAAQPDTLHARSGFGSLDGDQPASPNARLAWDKDF